MAVCGCPLPAHHSDDRTAWTVAPQPACSALGLLSTSVRQSFARIPPLAPTPAVARALSQKLRLGVTCTGRCCLSLLLLSNPSLASGTLEGTTLSATINRLPWYFHLELYIVVASHPSVLLFFRRCDLGPGRPADPGVNPSLRRKRPSFRPNALRRLANPPYDSQSATQGNPARKPSRYFFEPPSCFSLLAESCTAASAIPTAFFES